MPTTIASTSPWLIKWPAILSEIKVIGIPSSTISHAVSRAPCKNGLVSSAITEIFFPDSTADLITPNAVPWPAVAKAPALQWVKTLAPSGNNSAPKSPIVRLIWISSDRILWASIIKISAISLEVKPWLSLISDFILSTAQKRLIAVGLLLSSISQASLILCKKSGLSKFWIFNASNATPYAAAQPIAGAPRTTIDRIPSATDCAVE